MPSAPKSLAPHPAKTVAVTLLCVIASASLAGNAYLGYRLTHMPTPQVSQDENTKIIEDVGKLIELPQDETATIAKVDDPDALKKQGVFLTAQKDDVVLIYPKAKKAILYRPSSNRVIDISPINITDPGAQAPAPAPTAAEPVNPTDTTTAPTTP